VIEALALADSHAHLDMDEFNPDRETVIERARQQGVVSILCPAEMTTPRSVALVLELTGKYPWIAAAAGGHPHRAKEFLPSHLAGIKDLFQARQIVAVGEIGLDFHYNISPPKAQKDAFRAQLGLAQELGRPVIIHSRNAGTEVISLVEESGFSQGGVLHCFTESWETAAPLIERGFVISFSGILTYPNARTLRETAAKIPLPRLLVETDSPYLVPEPLRGRARRNEPAFVVETARALAGIKKVTLEELAQTTLRTFRAVFGLSPNLPLSEP
jgi:TatD DNase family protein